MYILERGGGAASGMRISCVRAGAGWKFLSSVRDAGKVPKRAPNDQETVTFIDKSAKVDFFQVLK